MGFRWTEELPAVYTAPLDKDTTLDEIYRRFNIEHPSDYKDIPSLGRYCGVPAGWETDRLLCGRGADYRQVPEFFAQPEKVLTPDECMTGEQIQTPRGRFYLTDRSRGTDGGRRVWIPPPVGGTAGILLWQTAQKAFAIPTQPESHIKTAEMSTEQNYNMIDGMMNNAPSMEELEARAKAGEQISLLDVAEAAKAEAKKPKQTRKTTQKQRNRPSGRMPPPRRNRKEAPAREKSKEMEVEECISPWKKNLILCTTTPTAAWTAANLRTPLPDMD